MRRMGRLASLRACAAPRFRAALGRQTASRSAPRCRGLHPGRRCPACPQILVLSNPLGSFAQAHLLAGARRQCGRLAAACLPSLHAARRLRWLVLWPLRACRRGRLSRLLPSHLIPRLGVSPPTAFAHLLVCRRPGFAVGPSAAAACCARLRFTGREDVFHFLLLEGLPQTVEVLGVYRAKLVSWSKGLLPAPAPGISTSGTSFIQVFCYGW